MSGEFSLVEILNWWCYENSGTLVEIWEWGSFETGWMKLWVMWILMDWYVVTGIIRAVMFWNLINVIMIVMKLWTLMLKLRELLKVNSFNWWNYESRRVIPNSSLNSHAYRLSYYFLPHKQELVTIRPWKHILFFMNECLPHLHGMLYLY